MNQLNFSIGILVNGSFATIGSLSEMKKKYEDYLIVVEDAVPESVVDIERIVTALISKAKIDPNPEQKGLVFRVNYLAMLL